MSNKPFDREVINLLERPLSTDVNEIGSYADLALRELVLRTFSGRAAFSDDRNAILPAAGGAAFIGSGFRVRGVTGSLQVTVDSGLGFFDDNTTASSVGGVGGVDDLSLIKPLTLTALETINVPAADPTNPRMDIVEVQFDRRLMDATSRDVLNPVTGQFTPGAVNKTLSYNQNGRSTVNGVGSINYKTGTPAASPSGPAVDAGYVQIGQVLVPALATAVLPSNVNDQRLLMAPGNALRVSGRYAYNSTTGPTGGLTLQQLSAPPGVQVGAFVTYGAGASAADLQLYMVAGRTPFNCRCGFQVVDDADNNNFFISNSETLSSPYTPGGVGFVFAAGASDQAQMASSIPPVIAAVGQQVARFGSGQWRRFEVGAAGFGVTGALTAFPQGRDVTTYSIYFDAVFSY